MASWRKGLAVLLGLGCALIWAARCGPGDAQPCQGAACLPSHPNNPSQAPGDAGVPPPPDAGTPTDAGLPPPPPDGGTDGGEITFGGPGPWPIANITYGMADGIGEGPVVGVTTDETQNLWVATRDALYLMRPGETHFHRYDGADGLHLMDNPAYYCANDAPKKAFPDCATASSGAAVSPGITAVVGGGPNEVFVGYAGDDSGDGTKNDPGHHSGKIDRVRLNADGALQVDRFDLVSEGHGGLYWHNRTIERMVYDHFHHEHALYVGANHGVDLIMPDRFRYPHEGEWYNTANAEWMGDHLHPEVCYHKVCTDESGLRLGAWFGLAIGPDGSLWVAGRWGAGEILWDPTVDQGGDVGHWATRGGGAFGAGFGDPYTPGHPVNACGFEGEPVFKVPQEGDVVSLTAVTVAPDGKVWFASGKVQSGDVPRGIAAWDGHCFTTYTPSQAGLLEDDVKDLIALPDGRLAVAGAHTGVVLWDPSTNQHWPLNAENGYLADDDVERMELDTMVDPPALHIATRTGATVLRQLPPM